MTRDTHCWLAAELDRTFSELIAKAYAASMVTRNPRWEMIADGLEEMRAINRHQMSDEDRDRQPVRRNSLADIMPLHLKGMERHPERYHACG